MAENKILLEIKDLHASVGDKEILRGIDLTVREGETHAIMGPNGSGKSTLSAVLAGRDSYTVTAGEVTFNGRDILDLTPEERSFEGLFLSFQYPIEIPGVTNVNFMRTAVNEHRRHKGLEPLNTERRRLSQAHAQQDGNRGDEPLVLLQRRQRRLLRR